MTGWIEKKEPQEELAAGWRVRKEAEKEREEKSLRGCTPESFTAARQGWGAGIREWGKRIWGQRESVQNGIPSDITRGMQFKLEHLSNYFQTVEQCFFR